MSFVYIALAVLLYLILKLVSTKKDYFEKKGIPFSKPPFFLRSLYSIILRPLPLPHIIKIWYDEFPNEKMTGVFEFSKPVFIVRDPKLIKKIAVKEFDSFLDHRVLLSEDIDPLFGRTLFSLTGQKWKDMRATLSPAFTGSKMRQMFGFVSSVGQQAAETIKNQIENGGESSFEFKDLSRKFTVDVIATCAFGIEVNSFNNPKNDFHRMALKLADLGSMFSAIKFIAFMTIPSVMKMLKLKLFDEATTNFFQGAITETMKVREEEGIIRHDMINLLMQAVKGKLSHEKDKEEEDVTEGYATVKESQVGTSQVVRKWSNEDLNAQCFIFFFAGFDTVSTVMTFLAYELMANPDTQKKLQDEIDAMNKKLDGKAVNYEQIQGMKYMDQVVCETLRKWPPAPMIDRVCVKDYNIEYDDKSFTIEKDRKVYFPMFAIHRDEKYFKNPEKFDPDRFSQENRGNIDPDTYLPFGIGPRNCIGSRFALMEIKTVIFYLLQTFDFEPTKRTVIPMKLSPTPIQLKADGGVWIGFKPRK